jgi:hypothetical protein
MKTLTAIVAVAAVLSVSGWAALAPAHARPPTITNSPGYDARLAESRQAWSASQYYYLQQSHKPLKRLVPRRVTPVPQR